MNALLALLASVLWGTSDFGGGIMSRRVPAAAAVLISQAFAFVLLLGLLPVRHPPAGGYLLLAAGAGAYTMLAVAAHGDLYGTLLAQRAGGLVALGPVVAATGILRGIVLSARRLAALAAIGVSDIVANGSYAYAASRGNLAIAAVLASLYPVVTALLARGLLAERLRPVQTAGVVTALCGVVMLAA